MHESVGPQAPRKRPPMYEPRECGHDGICSCGCDPRIISKLTGASAPEARSPDDVAFVSSARTLSAAATTAEPSHPLRLSPTRTSFPLSAVDYTQLYQRGA